MKTIKVHIAAIFLYPEKYADSKMSIIKFYNQLSLAHQFFCGELVRKIMESVPHNYDDKLVKAIEQAPFLYTFNDVEAT